MNATAHTPDDKRRAAKPRHRWLRLIGWIVIAVGALSLAAAATVAILMRSAKFHRYLTALVEKKASAALGTQVQVQNLNLHLSSLSADVYGVTILGAEPYPTPPLLQVRHIAVNVRVVSILHRKWYLNDLRIDDPVARIFTDAQGVSNIPRPKSSGGGHISIFDIGIRHVLLDHGEAYYNDKKTALAADLDDVDFHSTFNAAQKQYTGNLRYQNGNLQFGTFCPIQHDLQVQFIATPSEFRLQQAQITSGSSRFSLAATVQDYAHFEIHGSYQAALSGNDFRRILRNPSLPAGIIAASGTLEYRQVPGESAIDGASIAGRLQSARLLIQSGKFATQVRDVAANYSLVSGSLSVSNFHARLLGGQLGATLNMHDISGNTKSRLTASFRGISLSEMRRIAPQNKSMRNIALAGTLNANANAAWGKSIGNLVAIVNANIQAHVAHAVQQGPAPIPVTGEIHGTYRAASKQLALAHSYIQMPQTKLMLNGAISRHSNLAVQFHSANLAELETIADTVRTSSEGQPLQPLGLAGTASFNGTIHGPTSAPHLDGQLVAANIQVKGTKWKLLRANISADPSLVRVENAMLQPAARGNIALTASVGLSHWSFSKVDPVSLQLHASEIDAEDLARIANLKTPIAGTLAANVNAHGTALAPAGNGKIALTHANIDEQPIQLVSIAFNGTDDQIHGTLSVHTPAGNLQGVVTVRPKEKDYSAQVETNGIQLSHLELLRSHNVDLNGVLSLHGTGQGTFGNPQFDATAEIAQLEIQQQTISGINLHASLANYVATANLTSQAINTAIQMQAKVQLSGDYPVQATLNTRNIPLQPLFAIYAPAEASELHGETEIHAELQGPLKNKRLLEAHITIPTLKLGYSNTIQLAAAAPVQVDYKNGILNLHRTTIRGTDTDLQLQGTVPLESRAAASVLLLGTVNLQLAQLFNPDIQSSGQLKFNVNTYGARANPNIEGRVDIVDASFTNSDLPIGVQHGNGVLTLTKDRLNIQSFRAAVGGGTVTAQGGVTYRPSLQFDLAAHAQGIRMLYPQGVREEIGANITLTGTTTNAVLGGRVQLVNLSFTPDFDLTNFAGQLSGGVSPPPSQGFAQNLRLNLAINSTNNLNLVSRTLSVDGTANLQVRGTAAQPVILGRVNISDGDIIFNGNRFTLGGGTVEFVNPAQTQPVINIALNTTIQQYNIHLRFNGPVDQLRTNYSSDPSLPAADIINLLAFGQTTEAAAANPTPGDQAAMSAVAGQVSSQLTSRVAKVAGISQLSINPVLAGGSTAGPAGAIITIQQRVTGNFFVTFSSNVTSTQNQIIMGQYRLSPKVSLSATRDQNGGIAFDTTFKKSW